jgi:hypothetical protein
MLRYLREFWDVSKKIICNYRGNGGHISERVIFDSYKKARMDCQKYCQPQYPCSYCDGERKCVDIKITKLRDRPDEYKTPPPGAKDLKIIARKGGEEWIAEYTVKCKQCGLEKTEDFWDNMYTSYQARRGSQSSGRCFIATAVYGSTSAQEVVILQRFRDEFLNGFLIGRMFIRTYNRISSKMATFISRHSLSKAAFRFLLTPVIKLLLHIYSPPNMGEDNNQPNG